MSRLFPHPQDRYPVVYLKDTDLELPEHVRNSGMRYTQFKTVARGGKCLIQSCKDYHLSRVVAYKSLHEEFADDPIEQARFLREARVTAMLQHPNTIPIYELSRDNRDHFFFTMKLVEGYTLREVLDTSTEEGTLPVDGYGFHRMVTILIQIANALDYAHSHRVVHRDVKPANILMGPFGEVLLLDWGLAKVWNEKSENIPDRIAEAIREERAKYPFDQDTDPSLTSRGRLQGTALYMSPEQIAESEDLDHRSDIYSLGVVLYEILAGRHMIEGDKVSEVLEHAAKTKPLRPSDVATDRDIPEELENICMRCIEKDPERRLQTARELVAALRSWRLRWTSQSH
ncbi:MAG: serine/threonine-protein kinase [Myxococcales bacterium]|nr:serine/threonine protein kinase [Myxococcales bacterium]HIK86128.1 serine/threonine protein kinase [Myxococcales bacterium]